jgi:hypothetical protein
MPFKKVITDSFESGKGVIAEIVPVASFGS